MSECSAEPLTDLILEVANNLLGRPINEFLKLFRQKFENFDSNSTSSWVLLNFLYPCIPCLRFWLIHWSCVGITNYIEYFHMRKNYYGNSVTWMSTNLNLHHVSNDQQESFDSNQFLCKVRLHFDSQPSFCSDVIRPNRIKLPSSRF